MLMILIMLSLPFEFYNYLMGARKYLMAGIHFLMIADLIFYGKFRVTQFNLMFLIIGYIAFSILYYYHDFGDYLRYIIQFSAVFLVLIYIDSFNLFKKFIKAYLIVMFLSAAGGIIGFFWALSGKPPLGELVTPNRTLIHYGFTLTPDAYVFPNFTIIRFSGFFDEPGTFGYYHMYGLIFGYLTGVSRKYLGLLAVMGIFSFSLAYILSLIVFMFFYILWFYRISLKKSLLIAVILVSLIGLFNLETLHESPTTTQITRFLNSRLQSASQATLGGNQRLIQGDNRTVNMLFSYSVFKENPLFGLDKEDLRNSDYRIVANLFTYFAQHGLIGVAALYFMFFYLIYFLLSRNHKITIYMIFFVILINFYQRPFFSSGYFGYLLIPTLIYSIKEYNGWYDKPETVDN